ncbi:MAG: hypothetical protein K8R25_14990, partial [Methanosarcinales archaeon]|nr:hypothetical protein [Methanosarcinales archaeon]
MVKNNSIFYLLILFVIFLYTAQAGISDDSIMSGSDSYTIFATDSSWNIASNEVNVIKADNSAPVITGPEDMEVDMGETVSIKWIIIDPDPGTYEVYRGDEIIVDPTPYNSIQSITVQVRTDETGTFTYTIHARDGSDNEASDRVSVTVKDNSTPEKDNSAPVITGPGDVEVDMDETASIEWTIIDLDPDTYQVYLDGDIFKDTTSYVSGQKIKVTVETDKAGIFTYTIRARDKSGNIASDGVNVTVEDNSAPVITGPGDVEVDMDETASIEWTIIDLDPDTYQVYLDGDIFKDTTSYVSGQKIKVTVETDKAGIFTYTIRARDKSGNIASDGVNVTVEDNSAPVITGPGDVEVDMDETASIEWTIIDLDPDTYQVYLDGDIFKDTTSYVSGQKIKVTVETDKAGIFNYTIRVRDKSGNTASDGVNVTVKDNSAPVITGPGDMEVDMNVTASIEWTIVDLDPDTYRVHRDNEMIIDSTSYNNTQKITVPIE